MAVFKCKMCGGAMKLNGQAYGQCPYCGTTQTFPKLNDERRAQMYDRANEFRRANEFDKAFGIYQQILSEEPTDAEAYWSVVLCTYGVVYVEDPRDHKRIPTVNRAQYASIFTDKNYLSAIEHADDKQKEIFEAEAKVIDNIQKGILDVSSKEEPFDVFICYKETNDANGERTNDSVYAYDIYESLVKEGYRVFFSRVTLENKLGTAFEPYIFAALNSAKVMLVVGTSKDNFNAVWVKNEWARYLSLMSTNKEKVLIPVYRDCVPTDLPDEFAYLQAQDMSKVGAMQDLVRGVKKILGDDVKQPTIINTNGGNVGALVERAFITLELGDFVKADALCEQALNQDPKNVLAYLCKLLAEVKKTKKEELANCEKPFDSSNNYQMIYRFADNALKAELDRYLEIIKDRIAQQEKIRLEKEEQERIAKEQVEKEQAEKTEAERLEREKEKELKKAKKKKKLLIIFAIIIAIAAIVVLLIEVIIPNIRLSKERKEEKAYKSANSCELKDADKGNIVKFGTYQGEDIEWLVLDKQGDKIFVTTYYAIDCKPPYNIEYVDVTWEDCTLRTWLNKDFYNAAFSDEEKSMIPTTNVVNKDNTECGTYGGNDTKDKVFLLSIDEVNKYFSDDKSRKCVPTNYAVAQGCWQDDSKHYSKGGEATCWWWLRSPGSIQRNAACVGYGGDIPDWGSSVKSDTEGVRPALWINLES